VPESIKDSDLLRRAVEPLIVPSVGPVELFAAASNLRLVAIGGLAGPVTVWAVSSPDFWSHYQGRVDQASRALAWAPDASLLALVTLDAVRIVRPPKRFAPLWPSEAVAAWTAGAHVLAVAPDASQVVVATSEGWATIGLGDGGVRWRSREPTQCLGFSPGGEWLLVGAGDGSLSLWRTDGWQEHARVQLHDGPVVGLTVSQDGRWAATHGIWSYSELNGDPNVHVVTLPDLDRVTTIDAGPDNITFRPRTQQLTVAEARKASVHLHDLTTGRTHFVFEHDEHHVESLAYNRSGSILLAASFQSGSVSRVDMRASGGHASSWLDGCFGTTGSFAVDTNLTQILLAERPGNDDECTAQLRRGTLYDFKLHNRPESMSTHEQDEGAITEFGFIGDEPWARWSDGQVFRHGYRIGADLIAAHTTCAATTAGDFAGLILAGPGGAITGHALVEHERFEPRSVRSVTLLAAHPTAWSHLARLSETALVGVDAAGDAWLIRDGRAHRPAGHNVRVNGFLAISTDGTAALLDTHARLRLWRPETGELAEAVQPAGVASPTPCAAAFSPDSTELAVGWGSILVVHHGAAIVGQANLTGSVVGLAWTLQGRGILVGIPDRGVELWRRPKSSLAGPASVASMTE
jgi:hypothetical protein